MKKNIHIVSLLVLLVATSVGQLHAIPGQSGQTGKPPVKSSFRETPTTEVSPSSGKLNTPGAQKTFAIDALNALRAARRTPERGGGNKNNFTSKPEPLARRESIDILNPKAEQSRTTSSHRKSLQQELNSIEIPSEISFEGTTSTHTSQNSTSAQKTAPTHLLQRAKQAMINSKQAMIDFGTAVYHAPGKAVAWYTGKQSDAQFMTIAKNNLFKAKTEYAPLTTENIQKHNLNNIKSELANIPNKSTITQKTQPLTKNERLAQINVQKEINVRNERDAQQGLDFSETL